MTPSHHQPTHPTRALRSLSMRRPDMTPQGERLQIAEDFACQFAHVPLGSLHGELSEHALHAGPSAVLSAAMLKGGFSTEKTATALDWAFAAIKTPSDLLALEHAVNLFATAPAMLPGLSSSSDPCVRGWGAMQIACGSGVALAIQRNGLGFARVPSMEWPKILRFADWQAPSEHGGSIGGWHALLTELLNSTGLDYAMGSVSKDSLHQTIMRRTQEPSLAMAALRASNRAGFPAGSPYEGMHPLWTMCKLDARRPAAHKDPQTFAIYGEAMAMGFGPTMELPYSMSLSLNATQAKNCAPTLPLEWAKRSLEGCSAICQAAAKHGASLDARNASGETVLAILNRAAGREASAEAAERQFFEIVALGADPLAIAPAKDSASLAVDEQARSAILALQERKALSAGLDESIVARAKELMAEALASRAQSASPRRQRL